MEETDDQLYTAWLQKLPLIIFLYGYRSGLVLDKEVSMVKDLYKPCTGKFKQKSNKFYPRSTYENLCWYFLDQVRRKGK